MGYTHYWSRPPVIQAEVFRAIRMDFEKLVLPLADLGVPLAAWDGRNEPRIDGDDIRFNGVRDCGHPKNEEICIPYPTDDARGVGPSHSAVADVGLTVKLRHRCCSGTCNFETFAFPRVADKENFHDDDPETNGLVSYWTKTGFRPYDIAVTAALVIAKRYLRNRLVINSNGLDPQWADAKELCQQHLGYGNWFGIVEDPRIELWPGPNGTKIEREVRLRVLVEMDPAGFRL